MIFNRKEEETKQLPPKKIKKEEESEFEWDIKRILIAGVFLIVLVVAGFEGKKAFLGKNPGVLGESIQNKPIEVKKPTVKAPINVSSTVDSAIREIKNNITNLDPKEVASSSPQVQKVLRDMQQLQDLPANQAREACTKICSGL